MLLSVDFIKFAGQYDNLILYVFMNLAPEFAQEVVDYRAFKYKNCIISIRDTTNTFITISDMPLNDCGDLCSKKGENCLGFTFNPLINRCVIHNMSCQLEEEMMDDTQTYYYHHIYRNRDSKHNFFRD